ncbi:MAG: ATP-binding protein, partial [Actinomycetota bacterium]
MLRSIPLRLKLVAALILPMLVVAGYLYVDIDGALERRSVAAAQSDEVEAFQAVATLSSSIGAEHVLMTARDASEAQLAQARGATDAAYEVMRSPESPISADRLQQIDGHYGTLLSIRESLGSVPTETRLRANIELRNGEGRTGPYSTSLSDLAELPLQVLAAFEFDSAAIDDVVASSLIDDYFLVQRARADIRREATTLLRVAALPGNLVDAEVTESVTSVIAGTDESLEVLAQLVSIEVAGEIDSMMVSPAWTRYDGFRNAVDAAGVGQRIDIDDRGLQAAAVDLDSVLAAESGAIVDELQSRADASVSNENRDVVVSALIGLWLVIGVGLVLRFLYRAIKNPLQQLTEQASHVARVELPSIIEGMRRGEIEQIPEIEMMPVESNDEVGSLVNAFNDMHRSAVDLAAEQAESRRVVADMFVNLGRRNQRLVGKMLSGLTGLEQNEQDPDKLAELYELDHTATRMRRNAESLLVLAGAGQARRMDQPVAIDDLARAAIGEVENYQRVRIDVKGEERLDGAVVADVTHLLAELVENALTFSPPNSPVEVVAGQTSAGYVVAVNDHGIGMLPEQIEEANDRILGAAGEEESPSEFLGHYVVGRLGARHGIRVELSEGPAGGITARAMIPSHLLIDPTILVPGEADPAAPAPRPTGLAGLSVPAAPAAAPAPAPLAIDPLIPAAPAAPAVAGAPTDPGAAPMVELTGLAEAPAVESPAAAAVDPALAPLGGTNPVDTALPDQSPTPLEPSSDSTDFLASLEAAGIQRRTSKRPESADEISDMRARAEAAVAPAFADDLDVLPMADDALIVDGGEPRRDSLAALSDSFEVPDEPTDVELEADADSTGEIAAPISVDAPVPVAADGSLAAPTADAAVMTAPAPTAPPVADLEPSAPAAGGDSPFASSRRRPGANMPKTELISTIVGSMGSIFGESDADDEAES